MFPWKEVGWQNRKGYSHQVLFVLYTHGHPWGNVGTTGAGSKALLGPDSHSWYPPTPVAERACALCTCQPYTQHHLPMWAGKHKLYTPQTLLLGGSVCPIHYPMQVRSTTHSPIPLSYCYISIPMIIILMIQSLTYFFKYLLVFVLLFMYSNEVFSGYSTTSVFT